MVVRRSLSCRALGCRPVGVWRPGSAEQARRPPRLQAGTGSTTDMASNCVDVPHGRRPGWPLRSALRPPRSPGSSRTTWSFEDRRGIGLHPTGARLSGSGAAGRSDTKSRSTHLFQVTVEFGTRGPLRADRRRRGKPDPGGCARAYRSRTPDVCRTVQGGPSAPLEKVPEADGRRGDAALGQRHRAHVKRDDAPGAGVRLADSWARLSQSGGTGREPGPHRPRDGRGRNSRALPATRR